MKTGNYPVHGVRYHMARDHNVAFSTFWWDDLDNLQDKF